MRPRGSRLLVRLSRLPLRTRMAWMAGALALYLALFFWVGGAGGMAVRPLNLLLVIAAGVLFGLRGGVGVMALAALMNVGLYLWFGLFGEGLVAVGNWLSILAGLVITALVGRMRDLSVTLAEEVARREAAERRKEELSALMVHDLKSPLAGIHGHAQLLTMFSTSAREQQESARIIRDAAEQMNRMVMNLLDIGRAEDGELRLHLERVDMPELLADACDTFLPVLDGKRLSVAVDERSRVEEVWADRDLLKRVVQNLVDNAVKHTPKEGVIEVRFQVDEDELELSVRDEGPGVLAGHEERIFEKYARLGGDPAVASTSRGLGLHFCRLAAAAHGGRIWVEAGHPRGSVFRVRLPRRPPPH